MRQHLNDNRHDDGGHQDGPKIYQLTFGHRPDANSILMSTSLAGMRNARTTALLRPSTPPDLATYHLRAANGIETADSAADDGEPSP